MEMEYFVLSFADKEGEEEREENHRKTKQNITITITAMEYVPTQEDLTYLSYPPTYGNDCCDVV